MFQMFRTLSYFFLFERQPFRTRYLLCNRDVRPTQTSIANIIVMMKTETAKRNEAKEYQSRAERRFDSSSNLSMIAGTKENAENDKIVHSKTLWIIRVDLT